MNLKSNLAPILAALALSPAGATTDTKDSSSVELLRTGMRLPTLTGDYLTGRKATLPDAASGKVALLALGFTYGSRFAVEEWMKHFRAQYGKNAGVTFYEVPMIGGMARLGSWFINSGMRKGTPKELHENVITVYGGTGPWKSRLRYKEEDAAYLILLDTQGVIRWLHAGPYDESRFNEMAAEVSMLLAARP